MTGTELTIVLVAVIAGSIVKAVTGMGLPIIAIPVAALFVDLDDAVVTIALPNLVANGVLAVRERSHVRETRDLPALAVFGVLGALVGVLAFVWLPSTILVVVLIIAIVAYVTTFLTTPDLEVTAQTSRRWSPAVGAVSGAFQGSIGISGPIIGSWIHSYRLQRGAHILSVTSLFLITGATQFAVLAATGELAGRMVASLLACIPVLASIPIGASIRDRVSTKAFDRAVIGMLLVSVVALGVRTFT